MTKFLDLQKKYYGMTGKILTNVFLSKNDLVSQKKYYGMTGKILTNVFLSKNDLVSQKKVIKFLLTLNKFGYSIKNVEDIFQLSKTSFETFKNEIFDLFDSFRLEGFIFRDNFAQTEKLVSYTEEDWKAMFAQYSLTYGNTSLYKSIFHEEPLNILNKYIDNTSNIITSIKTNNKEITILFDLENDIKNIISDLFSSKVVLRQEQLSILEDISLDLIEKVYINDFNSTLTIKDTEIIVIKKIINSGRIIKPEMFKDMDQIVRTIYNIYSFEKKTNKPYLEVFPLNTTINNTILKEVYINIPTKMKKVFTKAINNSSNEDYIVEKMFKYYDFWKNILLAIKWESEDKTKIKYPTFFSIKEKLYLNNRKNTFNGRIENAKKRGNYNYAIKELSTNPGFLMRNLLEYLRYIKGTTIAKKAKRIKYTNPNRFNRYTDEQLFNHKVKVADLVVKGRTKRSKKDQIRSEVVLNDASNFFKSEDFVSILQKTNTKLLWQTLTLLEEEKYLVPQNERYISATKTYVKYSRELPALNVELTKIVKKQINKAIKNIKKEENKSLGKVFLSEDLKNYNVEFSGRTSTSSSFSGEYLTPGSKIDIKQFLGQDKIIRLGIAWKGAESCDIDHSLNLFEIPKTMDQKNYYSYEDKSTQVYFGNPELSCSGNIIISSSGDITSCNDKLFSVEFIDIDLDKALEYNLSNMFSNAVQFSGRNFDNYEVYWFMNIIDKKDRVISGSNIDIQLDKMDYAIRINEGTKNMLGFYINLKDLNMEVLNISLKNDNNYSTASSCDEEFRKIISNRQNLLQLDKALLNVIKKSQFVSSIEEANIVISSKYPEYMNKDIIYLTPGKELEKINNIIF